MNEAMACAPCLSVSAIVPQARPRPPYPPGRVLAGGDALLYEPFPRGQLAAARDLKADRGIGIPFASRRAGLSRPFPSL